MTYIMYFKVKSLNVLLQSAVQLRKSHGSELFKYIHIIV